MIFIELYPNITIRFDKIDDPITTYLTYMFDIAYVRIQSRNAKEKSSV